MLVDGKLFKLRLKARSFEMRGAASQLTCLVDRVVITRMVMWVTIGVSALPS